MQIKAAIFDMDGTLVNSLILWDVFWTEFGKRFRGDAAFRPTQEDDKAVRTLTVAAAMYLIHEKYHLGESGAQLLRIANEIMVDFYKNRVEMKPGARELLDALRAQGTKMCIASGTAQDLMALALAHCDLKPYFDRTFSCADIGKGKDQPDIYLLAQEYLGEKAEDIWVFEDSLTAIETVQKLGMRTVAVYDRYNYGQETMRKIADHYIAEGETLINCL